VRAPIWLRLAMSEMGQTEIPGPDANARILTYHSHTTLKAGSDEVPWCSAFMNFIMAQSDIPGTGSAAAMSWKDWGRSWEPQDGPIGAIAVFSRPTPTNPNAGHVGLIWWHLGGSILILGGNQSNQVRISNYRLEGLVSVRWPKV